MRKILIALAAVASLGATDYASAQNTRDDTELLISQIQTDKRAVVLQALNLNDAEIAKFMPVYDAYQSEMQGVMKRTSDVVNKFAANYENMTDDAAKSVMKDFFAVRDERAALLKKYARKMEKALPASKVLRWVQVENKLTTVLDLEAARIIPLS